MFFMFTDFLVYCFEGLLVHCYWFPDLLVQLDYLSTGLRVHWLTGLLVRWFDGAPAHWLPDALDLHILPHTTQQKKCIHPAEVSMATRCVKA